MTRPIVLADFADPAPSAPSIQSAAFGHDARLLAYLQPGRDPHALDLRILDTESGLTCTALSAQQVGDGRAERSLAEELARERARQRFDGVTSFAWLPASAGLVCAVSNRLAVVDAASLALARHEHDAYIEYLQLSDDGTRLVFCSGSELWLLDTPRPGAAATGPARRLTHDATATRFNGLADQITREEIYNGAPCRWNKDGGRLVFASFDVSAVESIGISDGAQTRIEQYFYARPGLPVARFAVSTLDVDTGERAEILAASDEWPYLCGLAWRGPEAVLVTRLSRDQTRYQLLKIALPDRRASVLLEQTQLPWINAGGSPMFRGGSDDSFFLAHERAGVGRIGLFDAQGAMLADIGADGLHVEGPIGLVGDGEGEGVYFTATAGDGLTRHVYRALASNAWVAENLTPEPGIHDVTIAPDGRHWLHRSESLTRKPETRFERIEDRAARHIFAPSAPVSEYEAGFVAPELRTVLAADGRTPLHAAVYAPASAPAGGAKTPVVLFVYGGPHAQSVRDSWALTADLRAQFLLQQGFAVVKIDNRGTSGRGFDFERPIHGRLGHLEVDDQCAALEQILAARPDLDRHRVGVCGWSYGGYMVLRCMQLRQDLFVSGVAGAPVVRWEDYDAPYTERYMGSPHAGPHLPVENGAGYRASDVVGKIDSLTGRLLVIHGLKDENVLFRHSAALIEALAAHGALHELLLLPGERHGVRGAVARQYLERRILDFLRRTLC
ncbi:S9 family peptidase [Variovorax rhizosphaerae]|uniref:Prolyl oligopeptidase family serine peptidase n=1 Tax=Variovorax rhizosphaerae TaxID=1836200 RepID=A0ABU8WEP9_9BURK